MYLDFVYGVDFFALSVFAISKVPYLLSMKTCKSSRVESAAIYSMAYFVFFYGSHMILDSSKAIMAAVNLIF
ncbi:MAG: hypothetical protein ACRYGG_07780 [Janthinobacterium lividum]